MDNFFFIVRRKLYIVVWVLYMFKYLLIRHTVCVCIFVYACINLALYIYIYIYIYTRVCAYMCIEMTRSIPWSLPLNSRSTNKCQRLWEGREEKRICYLGLAQLSPPLRLSSSYHNPPFPCFFFLSFVLSFFLSRTVVSHVYKRHRC